MLTILHRLKLNPRQFLPQKQVLARNQNPHHHRCSAIATKISLLVQVPVNLPIISSIPQLRPNDQTGKVVAERKSGWVLWVARLCMDNQLPRILGVVRVVQDVGVFGGHLLGGEVFVV